MTQEQFRHDNELVRTVVVSDEDKEAILKDILERNTIRRRAGLPPYDVDAQAQSEVADLADAMYEDRLRPYVERLYNQIEGSPGIAGRVTQHIAVYQAAEAALFDNEGIVRPRPVGFDITKFIIKYEQGKLKDWGGAFTPV
ncbi:MAG: hypothetical protein AAGD04_08330 [Pseudomonadota bacterium]